MRVRHEIHYILDGSLERAEYCECVDEMCEAVCACRSCMMRSAGERKTLQKPPCPSDQSSRAPHMQAVSLSVWRSYAATLSNIYAIVLSHTTRAQPDESERNEW